MSDIKTIKPEILEENDKFIKLKLNDDIKLIIDFDLLETNQVQVDFNEKMYTKQEIKEIVQNFFFKIRKNK